jgi:hypothetical protein
VPLILRYVLQTDTTAAEAGAALARLPTHMSYNFAVLDRDCDYLTATMARDRPAILSHAAVATNHQDGVEWVSHARFTATVERERFLLQRLALHRDPEKSSSARFSNPRFIQRRSRRSSAPSTRPSIARESRRWRSAGPASSGPCRWRGSKRARARSTFRAPPDRAARSICATFERRVPLGAMAPSGRRDRWRCRQPMPPAPLMARSIMRRPDPRAGQTDGTRTPRHQRANSPAAIAVAFYNHPRMLDANRDRIGCFDRIRVGWRIGIAHRPERLPAGAAPRSRQAWRSWGGSPSIARRRRRIRMLRRPSSASAASASLMSRNSFDASLCQSSRATLSPGSRGDAPASTNNAPSGVRS